MLHLILALMLAGWFAGMQQTIPEPILDQPLPGQALQGVVSIHGSTAVDGFASAQIEFRFENDPAQTWFLIQEDIPAVENGVLAGWDTTTITDGTYRIRLKVLKNDGSVVTVEIAGLRVRNYSAVETNTPASPAGATLAASATPTDTPVIVHNTPTPQPPNPVSVTGSDLRASAGRGLAAAAGLFLLFGIYLGVRRLGRR